MRASRRTPASLYDSRTDLVRLPDVRGRLLSACVPESDFGGIADMVPPCYCPADDRRWRPMPPERPMYDPNLDARERTYFDATEGDEPGRDLLAEDCDEFASYDREEFGTVLCWTICAVVDRLLAPVAWLRAMMVKIFSRE